jgi:hypothetical protein
MPATRFATARFHVASGPESLFRRVHHIMKKKMGGGTLRLTDHALSRLHKKYQHAASPETLTALQELNTSSWILDTATVRTDTGKFVSSAWRYETQGTTWMVVVGLHEVIQTAFPWKTRSGPGVKIIDSGKLYEKVQQVNQALMDDDEREIVNEGQHDGDVIEEGEGAASDSRVLQVAEPVTDPTSLVPMMELDELVLEAAAHSNEKVLEVTAVVK